MAYLATYIRNGQNCVRLIKKGFSCIGGELNREVRTVCGPDLVMFSHRYMDSLDAANDLIEQLVSEGHKNETGYDIHGNPPEKERRGI